MKGLMNTKRNSGFILMIVFVLIPLMGMAMAIFSANSKILGYQVRMEQLQQHAKDACRSGLTWASVHQSKLNDLEKTVILTVDESPVQIRCSIALISQNEIQKVYEVIGIATDSRYDAYHREQLVVKKNSNSFIFKDIEFTRLYSFMPDFVFVFIVKIS